MKTLKTPLAALVATLLLTSAAPGLAFTLVERNSSFDWVQTLPQAVMCDGSVKLAPGAYDIHFTAQADGGVLATFFQGGVRKGEAHGIIVVQSHPGVAAPAGRANTFSSLGFHSGIPSSFKQDGQSLKLVIGAQTANQIQVGLSLPAVQAPAAHAVGDPH